MADLPPCPFCGHTKAFVLKPTCTRASKYDPADRAYPIVKCTLCNAEAHGDNWDQTARSAVAAWNRRTSPDTVNALVEAARRLERAATRVRSLGAVSGAQWMELSAALIPARAALSAFDGGRS